MTDVTIPNTTGDIKIGELTDADVNGNGVFDVLMRSVKAHLKEEYDAERIRGTDYANAYVQSVIQVMQLANGYTLAKAKLPLELQLLEAQIMQVATDTAVATKQGGLLDAQALNQMAETNRINKEVQLKLPKEIELLGKDLLIKESQIHLTEKELALKDYELTRIKPKELALLSAEVSLKEKQIPIMEKELIIKGEQLKLAEYEFTYKAPAEVALMNAQKDLYIQKAVTEQAQTDGSVIKPNSVTYWTSKLTEEQSKTYKRDAEQKVAKLMIDTWMIRKNNDPDDAGVTVTETNALINENIGKAIRQMGTSIGIDF